MILLLLVGFLFFAMFKYSLIENLCIWFFVLLFCISPIFAISIAKIFAICIAVIVMFCLA